jgi:hypothetical protein
MNQLLRDLLLTQKAAIQYLLRDEFSTDLAAGSVNGTASEPGPGTRVVTDTGSKLSISGGVLSFATGGVAAGNPGVYLGPYARTVGRFFYAATVLTTDTFAIGWDTDNLSTLYDGFRFASSSNLNILSAGGPIIVGSWASATTYLVCVVMRAAGSLYFIKGGAFTNWTMIYASTTGSASFYASGAAANTTSVATIDYIRVPTQTWMPTPLASDGFSTALTDGLGHAEGTAGGLGSGGNGLTWTGATKSVSGGAGLITPTTLGSELLTNADFETWVSATNAGTWSESVAGTSTVNQETSITHGGSNAVRFDLDASNSTAQVSQSVTTIVGTWYQLSAWIRASAGTPQGVLNLFGADVSKTLSTTYVQHFVTGRATATSHSALLKRGGSSASLSVYVDDASVKALTLTELFASLSLATADVLADVNIIATVGTCAGLVISLDSASAPANFVIAYLLNGNLVIDKCVAGVYTNVLSAAATYSASATLRVTKRGTAYRVYYNNVLIGTFTVSDAGIISNTLHGLFNTYSGNTFDNFVVYASGSNGEYSNLDLY